MPEITTTTTTVRSTQPKQSLMSKEDEAVILKEIESYCKLWSNMANWFNIGIVILGVAAITTSVLVSIYTGSDLITPRTLKLLACISTISLALLTAFNLVNHSNDARNAWRALNASLMLYKAGTIDIVKLIEQYQKGEKQVGSVNFNYGSNGIQTEERQDSETVTTKTVQTKTATEEGIADDARANQITEEEESVETVTAVIKNEANANENRVVETQVNGMDADSSNSKKEF